MSSTRSRPLAIRWPSGGMSRDRLLGGGQHAERVEAAAAVAADHVVRELLDVDAAGERRRDERAGRRAREGRVRLEVRQHVPLQVVRHAEPGTRRASPTSRRRT